MAGAMSVIETHAATLVQAVKEQAQGTSAFAAALGIQMPPDAVAEQAAAADRPLALAALALAAAAHSHANPFEHELVKKLSAGASNDPAAAHIAISLWREADTYSQWAGDSALTRPQGMNALWQAVIARPPSSADVLVGTASNVSAYGYRSEGLALLRIAAARNDLTSDNRARMASQFARWHRLPDEAQRQLDSGGANAKGYDIRAIRVGIARARLFKGYDPAAAKIVLDDRIEALKGDAFSSYLGQEELDALEAAKAHNELLTLGDAYLTRARQPNDDPEDQGQWFAIASESYRRGGDKTRAVAAAREGLPLVSRAVTARVTPPNQEARPITDGRTAAVRANGFGTEPVVALYKAGARDEALATGFLTGFNRFRNAKLAGEDPDPQWVVDDRSSFYTEIVTGDLIWSNDARNASWFLQALQCSSLYGSNSQDEFNRELGLLSALSGRRGSMKAHLASAAAAVERGAESSTPDTQSYFALALAADWRRALTIAERVGAKDDPPEPPRCR